MLTNVCYIHFLLLEVVKMYKYRANYGVNKQLNIFYLNGCPKNPGILGLYGKDVVHNKIEKYNVDLRVFLQKYHTIIYFSTNNLRSWKLINKLKCTFLGGGVLDWLIFI